MTAQFHSLVICTFILLISVATFGAGEPPVVSSITMVSSPSLSPDGAWLAFGWRDDVWMAPVSGGSPTRITSNPAVESDPRFSPDGNELAFISRREGSPQIYVMPLVFVQSNVDSGVGGEDAPRAAAMSVTPGVPRQITFHSEGYRLHAWMPDGQSVIATGNRDHGWKYSSRMLKVNVRDRVADVVLADAVAADPAVDPSGERILFVREGERWWRKGYRGERAAQIWELNLASGEFAEHLHEGVDCRWPMWDADRNAFFFCKGKPTGSALFRIDLDSGSQTEVASFEDDSIVFPAISNDGTTIVFRHLFDMYRMQIGDARPIEDKRPVKIELAYDGDPFGMQDRLRRNLDSASEVSFSPDGLEILFTAGGELWAMDTLLKEPIRISETAGEESSPVLSSDGSAAYLVSVQDGQTDIWKIGRKSADGFWWQSSEYDWTRLTDDSNVESDLRLSPDGKHLFFVRDQGDLWRMTLDGGERVRLIDGFDEPEYDVSPCGTWVTYSASDSDFNQDVWIRASDGSGEPYNVSKHPDDDRGPKFSPDGKLLAFTGNRSDEESDIYYVYLQAENAEETSRQRLLEEAVEEMKMKRRKERDKKDGKASNKDSVKDDSGEPKSKDQKNGEEDSGDEEDDDDEDDEQESEENKITKPIDIDFEGLDDRLKRISNRDGYESNLVWSDDSKMLTFHGSVDGNRGTYTVTFPDELEPKKLSDKLLGDSVWTDKSKGLLGLSSGSPAKLEQDGSLKTYEFEVRQELSRSARFEAAFEQAWRVMRDRWYDPKTGGRNWNAVRRKYTAAAANAGTSSTFGEIMELMLGELNGSHLGFSVSRDEPSAPTPAWTNTTAHLGVRFDPQFNGPGWKVIDVLPDGPASRTDSRLYVDDVILSVNGVDVDPQMDPTLVLNGPLDRDLRLLVDRNQEEPIVVVIRPTSFSSARGRLYEKWLNDNRDQVDKFSRGRAGYLHIRSMDMTSFYEFEKQLYRVGYGKDAMVIDVRDNGGGSTTDLLLTALTQPRHAITVPRGGGQGYPQSRMVYAVWQKPIVVLCNQNSFSNAEIFSHAIKTLGRGKLVGVETAGGVISTGSVQIMDVGRMRMPFRGWFTVGDGQDMELHGAVPHHIVWPKPGEIPAGNDRQLKMAVKVLMKDLKKSKTTGVEPELIYATERKLPEQDVE